MKNILFLLVILNIHEIVSATEKINILPISPGKTIILNGSISLPKGQKLNKAAPSNITIFEKIGSDWLQVDKVNLNDFFTISQEFDVKKELKLQNDSSNLKLMASLYHCDKIKNNFCVIDDFEGLISRSPTAKTNNLHVDLTGTPPR